ncbi:MAG TPA: PadR family transcriptional regulator [Candidatus Deferrimicrobium sp.]|nr:PadR family transcriptional regulator [Candidatus Deferrimicrobium sp.]
MNHNIKLSHVSLAVLGLIGEKRFPQYQKNETDDTTYPYEIKKKIEEREMQNWTNIGQSSIYGVLKKLEEKELIESKITISDQNRTQKTLKITDKGIQVLKENVIDILSRGGRLGRDWDLAFSNIKFLTKVEKIKALESCIDALKANKDALRKRLKLGNMVFNGNPPLHFSGLFTRPLKLIAANVEFCEEVLAEIKKEKEIE